MERPSSQTRHRRTLASRTQSAIHDEGAALCDRGRIETAVRRAGLANSQRRCRNQWSRRPFGRIVSRSRLYLLHRTKYMINAVCTARMRSFSTSKIPSDAEKDAARILVRNALRAVSFGTASACCINQLPLGLEDLAEYSRSTGFVLIPKVEHPGQVTQVDG